MRIGNDWDSILEGEWNKPYYQELRQFLREEFKRQEVMPDEEKIKKKKKIIIILSNRSFINTYSDYSHSNIYIKKNW